MEGFLAKTTYRAILKHAVAIDKDAALRAVLVAFPCSFYDRRTEQWTAVDVRQEWLASRRAVDDFVRELNGSSDWYLPHRVEASATTTEEEANSNKRAASDDTNAQSSSEEGGPAKKTSSKRQKQSSKKKGKEVGEANKSSPSSFSARGVPSFLAGEATSHVRRLYRSSPLTIQNLNNAFAAVKMLSYVMQLQGQLLPCDGELVIPDPRNLVGFEVLKNGVAPIHHPSISDGGVGGESAGETTISAAAAGASGVSSSGSSSAALEQAKVIAAEAEAAKAAQKEKGDGVQPQGEEEHTTTTTTSAKPTTDTSTTTPPSGSSNYSKSADQQEKSADKSGSGSMPPTPSEFGLQLLVAHPLMGGFFRHSIVMLSQAGEGGALGFIINKPVVNDNGQLMPVWSFIPDTVHPIFSKHLRNNVVFIGGPVASPTSRHHALFILHRVPNVRGSIALGEGVYTTNDFNTIYHLLEEGKTRPEDIMVLLGYCGWGDGQLEHEERKGSWVVLRRGWDVIDERKVENFTTTADYVFSKNVVVDSAKNVPRTTAERLRVVPASSSTLSAMKKGGGKKSNKKEDSNIIKAEEDGTTTGGGGDVAQSSLLSSSERSAVGEPRLSWVSLFGTLGPKYRSMARLADVRVDPYDSELFE